MIYMIQKPAKEKLTTAMVSRDGHFKARIDHIEQCLNRISEEVAQLKTQGSIGWPRLDRIEGDLHETERELIALKGQGQVHDNRLVSIESSLKELHAQIEVHYKSVYQSLEQSRVDLAEHTTDEISRFNKILYGVLTTLGAVVLTFILNSILRGTGH